MATETGPLQAWIDSTSATLTSIAGLVSKLQTQVNGLALMLTVPSPTPVPSVDPQVQWKAAMETGSLSEWTTPAANGMGGEEVNSGSADTTVVTGASVGISAHGGTYVMKQAVSAAPGGTRMQRYPEVDALCRAGTKFYWTWWDYFPTPVSFSTSGMYQIWGILSIPTNVFNALSDVFFSLGFTPTGNLLRLTYNPTGRASLAPKAEYVNPTSVPVGQWVKFEIEYLPRGDATGSFRLWMNSALIFELLNTQTQYPLIGQAPLLSVIEQTGYGDVAFTHYVDDVTLSLGRMP